MGKQVQLLRGTAAENKLFTGEEGALTYNTETKAIVVHDGQTQGGGGFIDTVVEFQLPTEENNYTWYRKYASGWVEQGGNNAGYDSISGNIMIKNLIVPMQDNKYTAQILVFLQSSDGGAYWARQLTDSTATQLKYYMYMGTAVTTNNPFISWMVCGMAA